MIDQFISRLNGQVYVGFSGGKDSTVLLDLCYKLYPKMYNMFMNYTNNGVTYREAARKVLAVNVLELPDEKKQLELF